MARGTSSGPTGRPKGAKDKLPRIVAPSAKVVLSRGTQGRDEIARFMRDYGSGWMQSLVARAQAAGDLRLESQLLQFCFDRTWGLAPADPVEVQSAEQLKEKTLRAWGIGVNSASAGATATASESGANAYGDGDAITAEVLSIVKVPTNTDQERELAQEKERDEQRD